MFFYGTDLSAQCLILSPSHVILPCSSSHLALPAASKAPAHLCLLPHLLPSLFFRLSCFLRGRRMLKVAKGITTVQGPQEVLHANTVLLIPLLRSHCYFTLQTRSTAVFPCSQEFRRTPCTSAV